MLFTKREIVEMMFRPQPMPKSALKKLIEDYMHSETLDLVRIFSKATKLRIKPAGGNLYEIVY
jgi:hypothetical protein